MMDTPFRRGGRLCSIWSLSDIRMRLTGDENPGGPYSDPWAITPGFGSYCHPSQARPCKLSFLSASQINVLLCRFPLHAVRVDYNELVGTIMDNAVDPVSEMPRGSSVACSVP
jgi:hypothetical protein